MASRRRAVAPKKRTPRSYQREIRMLRDWLASVQWVQPMHNGSPSCSGCGEQAHLHDDAACGLTQILRPRAAAARGASAP